MLEDQLFLIVGLQHDRIFVERTDSARQLDPTQQVDRDVELFFAGRVEERVLDVLRRLVFHLPISLPLDVQNQLFLAARGAGGRKAQEGKPLAARSWRAFENRTPRGSTPYNTRSCATFQPDF